MQIFISTLEILEHSLADTVPRAKHGSNASMIYKVISIIYIDQAEEDGEILIMRGLRPVSSFLKICFGSVHASSTNVATALRTLTVESTDTLFAEI